MHFYSLDDIIEVVPVLKEGNKHAPRLANKISYRRGLIIVCKSHHRGRVVLQVGSKRERTVLLLGFTRLLEDVNRFEPTLDDTGAIRSRLPRKQSVIQFFDEQISRQEGSIRRSIASRNDDDRQSSVDQSESAANKENSLPTKLSKNHSTLIEHFYQTRFDTPAVPPITDQSAQPKVLKSQPVMKSSLFRRSSMTVGDHSVK